LETALVSDLWTSSIKFKQVTFQHDFKQKLILLFINIKIKKMVFDSHIYRGTAFGWCKSDDPVVNKRRIEVYRSIKRNGATIVLSGVTVNGICRIVIDAGKAKLKYYGYNAAIALTAGPAFSSCAVAFYTLSKAAKIRKICIMCSQIGSCIIRGEIELATFVFIPLDLLLFGEFVSPTEGHSYLSLGNETLDTISELVAGASD